MYAAFVVPRHEFPADLDVPSEKDLPDGLDREVAYRQTFTGSDLIVVAQRGPAAGTITAAEGVPVPRSAHAFTAIPDGLRDDLYVSAVPLLPDRRTEARMFAAMMNTSRHRELLAEMRRFDHGEVVFLQTGRVDYMVPVVIGDRPWTDEHRAAPGNSPFNVWVNGWLERIHGISFDAAPPPANELLWDVSRPHT